MNPIRHLPLSLALAALGGASAVPSASAADALVPPSMLSVSDPALEVTVWASSPMLRNPTNLDFDADGRAWVAEGVNYRGHYNRQPEGDRIVVLEDTDGDGRADRSDVFVQEPFLRAPMGIAVIDNRIVVSMAPDLVVYTDVNRDRKFDPTVDRREVILTGFNGRKHDHSIHSVTVGPDGQWYWNVGNCGAMFTDRSGKTFRIGSAYDPTYGGGKGDLGWEPTKIAGQRSDDGHVWIGGFAARMDPDGSGVRIIGHNFRNSYEQAVTSFGDVFQNDNDDPPACRTTFLLEGGNAGFCSADGQRAWQADRRPGQSVPVAEWRQDDPGVMPSGDVYGGGSPTGIAFVEESALGPKYRGLLLSCEPGRNVVFGYLPVPDGAGFKLECFDFLTSNKEGQFAGTDFQGGRNETRELKTLFRPSDVTAGPDGAIYVTDWFDARVGGHADWDEGMTGTIYRVAPRGFKGRAPKVDLSTIPGAVAALRSSAVNVRGAAFYALQRQGAAAAKPVSALLKDANPYVRARAVWLLALSQPDKGQVAALLSDRDPQVRVVAFRALRRVVETGAVAATRSPEKVPGTREWLLATAARLASDPSAAVRREVALALRDVPAAAAVPILVTLARGFDGLDRTYLEAWGLGARGKEVEVYERLKQALVPATTGPLFWSPGFAALAWRLHVPAAVGGFRTRALTEALPTKERKAALTALAFTGTKESVNAILETASTATNAAVKAEAVWWLLNRKDGAWSGFGLNDSLKQRGIYDPAQVEIIPTPIPPADPPKFTVADVLALRGDAGRGARLAQSCLSCHRLGDQGVEYAPDLTGWARRQTTEVLYQSILQPSAEIAQGFNGTEVVTTDDLTLHGLVISEGDPVVMMSAGGVTQTIPKARIKSRKGLGRSLMLSADQQGLSPQDVADIAAYLRTR